MHCIGLSLKGLGARLLMTCLLAGVAVGATAGNRLVVAVTINSSSDLDRPLTDVIRSEVGSSPLRILQAGATKVTVETDQTGYDYLLSAAELASVKIVSGQAAAEVADVGLASYTIRLTTGATVADGGKSGSVSALLLARQNGGVSAEVTGGGTLFVRALDSSGREVARQQIADPRIIRSETSDATGKMMGRHDYLSKEATLTVALPALASIRTLSIEEPAGNVLARLKIR